MGTVTSVATGSLRWRGHVLTCQDCGSGDRWTMIVDQPSDLDGEVAWLDCENGHRARHPLIYPDIVHRVSRSTADPKIPVRELYEWTPQWISLRSVPGQQPVPVYHDWTELGPVQWSREWLALVAAQRQWDEIHDEMNRLGRRGVDTSMSGISDGLFGFDGRADSEITLLPTQSGVEVSA